MIYSIIHIGSQQHLLLSVIVLVLSSICFFL